MRGSPQSLRTGYDRWLEALAFVFHRRYYVDHLQPLELESWKESESYAAFLQTIRDFERDYKNED